MKLILTAILLFTLGFFGTGFALHPGSPLNLSKLLSKEAVIEEEKATGESNIDVNEDKPLDNNDTDDDNVKEENKQEDKNTTSAPAKDKVTKRPADLSKPIVLSPEFVQLTKANVTAFLADKNPNIVIVGNFGSSADHDLVDSLNLLLEQFPMKVNAYVINTESTDLTIDRGALIIDANLRMSTSPAIYYQRAALVYYQRSLMRVDYGDLYEFFERIYE